MLLAEIMARKHEVLPTTAP